jgi:ribonuclease HI
MEPVSKNKRGLGAWAAVIIYPDGVIKELSGVYKNVTNNQMEITAVIGKLLDYIRSNTEFPDQVIVNIISDSEYVVKGKNEWLRLEEKELENKNRTSKE